MKSKLFFFPLSLILAPSSFAAGQFIWTGATNSTWTTASNWDITSSPITAPNPPNDHPIPGSTYADDALNIKNNGDLLPPTSGSTPGFSAIYDPGAGITTTFSGGRCFTVGTGTPGTNGSATLEVRSGTIAAVRSTNSGSEPYLANRANTLLWINGGTVDLSGSGVATSGNGFTTNNFRLIQEGQIGMTSTITITSGLLSCNLLDLVFDQEVDPASVFGTGVINLNGGALALTRFGRTAASSAGQTSFTLNLNGGTLRCRNSNANFLPALTDLQTLVKAGGAVIDTVTFNSTIAESLESGATTDGGLTINGTGAITLSGANTYNGGTTINAGSLIISSDANLGDAAGGIKFNAAGSSSNLNITADIASSNRIVTLAPTALGNIQLGAGVDYTNSGKFTGSGNLRFRRAGSGARTATLASLSNDFTGSLTIDQENTSEQIGVIVNSLADGVGYGNIICTALNTNTFPSFRLGVDAVAGLTLNNRRIELAGAMNTGSFFTIGNNNTTYPVVINTDLLVSGTAGTRRLSLSGVAGPINVFAGNIADGGSVVSVTKANSAAVWTLSGNNSHTGGTTLSGGTSGSQLNLNSATALGTGTFIITGGDSGRIDNTSAGPITLSTNNPQSWNNNFIFVGTKDLNLGTGAVTLGGNRTVFVQGSTLTVGGAIGEASAGLGLTKGSTGGTLVLTGSSTYTGATAVTGGTLSISSIADFGSNSAIGAPAAGTHIQIGGASNFCNFVYTGAAASTNRTVQLGDATPTSTGVGGIQNNGTGALTFTAANFNPTITGITAARTLWLGGTYIGGTNEIQGVIKDNDTAGKISVGKGNDSSIWQLSGANTYTGSTVVQGGALKLGATASIASSTALSISAGATLDTSAQATHTIPATQTVAFGIDSTGSGSSGKIAAAGLNVSGAVVTYNITGTPNDPVYVLATYTAGQLTGTFASVPTPPSGYTLNYAYEGNKIALVQGGSGFSSWQTANGTAQAINLDHDNDGVSNGVEYFLFGNASSTGFTALPSVVNNLGTLSVTWTKAASYTGAYTTDYAVETSDTLIGAWTPAALGAGADKVVISGNAVTYTFPAGSKKFARLKVTGP